MSKQGGFTLVEMMVTIMILGILVSVALPAYQSQIASTRRATATVCLTEYAQFMERTYSTNMSYKPAGASVTLPTTNCSNDLNAFYTFELGTPYTVSEFLLKATPKGSQASDTCGTLTVNQLGVRAAKGLSDAETIRSCW